MEAEIITLGNEVVTDYLYTEEWVAKLKADHEQAMKEKDELLWVYENTPFAHWRERALKAEDQIAELEEAVKEKETIRREEVKSLMNTIIGRDEQIAALTESRDEWKRQWRLMEAAEKMAEERIKELENEKLADTSATVIEGQQNAIAALTAENERLSGEWQQVHDWNNKLVSEHYAIKTENDRQAEEIKRLREALKVIFNSDWSINGPFTNLDVSDVCGPALSKARQIAQDALREAKE